MLGLHNSFLALHPFFQIFFAANIQFLLNQNVFLNIFVKKVVYIKTVSIFAP